MSDIGSVSSTIYDRAFNYLLVNFDYEVFYNCFRRAVVEASNHLNNN